VPHTAQLLRVRTRAGETAQFVVVTEKLHPLHEAQVREAIARAIADAKAANAVLRTAAGGGGAAAEKSSFTIDIQTIHQGE